MKVAITGASGYLGSCFKAALLKHGHDVISLSRRQCGENWIPYSLGDDPRLLPWEGVDVLIHTAYDFAPRHGREIHSTNVEPSIALFQATAEANVGNLIFISSMSSFEGCRSNYGKAKQMVEKEVLRRGGMVVRPGLVWGENCGGVMGALERALGMHPLLPFPLFAANARQFLIHQADLSEALVALAEQAPPPHQSLQTLAHPAPLAFGSLLRSISERQPFIPVPWPCVMAGLKVAEMLHMNPPFRSDSLVGLIHGDPKPEISAPPTGVTFRPFMGRLT